MRSAELTCPLYAATLSGPREGATAQGHGGLLPAATLLPYPRPNGSEGNGIGNARGIPPRGARRRHLFGCKGVRTSSRGRTSRGSVANQRHIPGARPARGCQSWTLCPRVRRRAPSVWIGLAGGTVLKLALRAEYSTTVLGCVQQMDGWGLQIPHLHTLPTPASYSPRGRYCISSGSASMIPSACSTRCVTKAATSPIVSCLR